MANPLTQDDKEQIERALVMIKDVQEDITRAEQAGMDVSAQKLKLAELQTQLQKIKGAFFPN